MDRGRALKYSVHAAHSAKQFTSKTDIAQQMIVQEIEVSPGQTGNLCERVVNHLGVVPAAAGEESVFVTERAVMRTATRNHNRVGHQIAMALNQIAPNLRD